MICLLLQLYSRGWWRAVPLRYLTLYLTKGSPGQHPYSALNLGSFRAKPCIFWPQPNSLKWNTRQVTYENSTQEKNLKHLKKILVYYRTYGWLDETERIPSPSCWIWQHVKAAPLLKLSFLYFMWWIINFITVHFPAQKIQTKYPLKAVSHSSIVKNSAFGKGLFWIENPEQLSC